MTRRIIGSGVRVLADDPRDLPTCKAIVKDNGWTREHVCGNIANKTNADGTLACPYHHDAHRAKQRRHALARRIRPFVEKAVRELVASLIAAEKAKRKKKRKRRRG